MSLVTRLTDALWNPWLLMLFLLAGLYFSLRTGFFQLFGAPVWLRATAGSLLRRGGQSSGRGISQFQALSTALASTIGTGSVAGVATAIWFGGPGAVLWMWVSALLGMMTSFVEKALAVRYRRPDGAGGWRGGPMYYLRDGLGCPALARWFAAACLCSALVGGNLVQSHSIAGAMESVFGWDRLAVGCAAAAAAGLVMVGGIGRIARVSSLLVPVMALLYVGGGGIVLAVRAERLPGVLAQIFTCALRPGAAAGGAAGYTAAAALRYGVARGVFTNEAGLGTAAIAHAAADVDCPARQGMWGIFEVGVSTLLVCTVTALVILVSGVCGPAPLQGGAGVVQPGAPMTAAAFSSVLGRPGAAVVALSLLLFAFTSILGWSYYGQQCLDFLAGDGRGRGAYRILFLACIAAGSVWNGSVWTLVDLCSALLALPNLAALTVLFPQAWETGWGSAGKKF
ncbi:MAG: alanine:cation symporter family protein [Lawsonibacter sp.]|nr:alanine:cation symporter family protein [Lawsonibacter sp.]